MSSAEGSKKISHEETVVSLVEDRRPEGTYRVIKKNPVRTVLSADGLMVKIYRVRALADKLRYLIMPSKARTEWEMAAALNDAGVPTVEPVAFGEKKKGIFLREAYFASVDLGDVEPLKTKVKNSAPQDRLRLAEKAAGLARDLHSAGFYHRDLHCGNVVVSTKDDLYVVDLHRMSRGVGRAAIIRNLATLFGPAGSPFDEGEAGRGVECYCHLSGIDNPEEIFARSCALAEEISEKHLASRTLRCIAESSRYTISRIGSARVYHRRSVGADDITRILEAHEAGKKEGAAVHDSRRSIATRIECGWLDSSPVLFVKEEKKRGGLSSFSSLILGSRTRNAWLASSALEVRRIPTPEPLAFIRRSRLGAGNIIVTRFVENAVSLKEMALRELTEEERASLISGLAPVCGALHRFGIYHSDWSAKNFLVCPGEGTAWRTYVVDTEAIGLRLRLTGDRIIKNLGQLNDVPGFTDAERAIFREIYQSSGGADLSDGELREISEYTRRRVEARARKAAVE